MTIEVGSPGSRSSISARRSRTGRASPSTRVETRPLDRGDLDRQAAAGHLPADVEQPHDPQPNGIGERPQDRTHVAIVAAGRLITVFAPASAPPPDLPGACWSPRSPSATRRQRPATDSPHAR
ncbi:hypothetical protein [Actinoallomurus acaciae]|uniref:Uncharacterized protein n=1 Tax=Actinoallomurus acaciae TaxID=502577 RepID=A0ABV5YNV9_9ACTN